MAKKKTAAKQEPMIRTLQDLIDHFGAADALNLNRRIYKDTDCGASISVRDKLGAWFHNGQSGWDELKEIDAFTIQTIIEGSDATVDSDTFELPVKASDVDHWIADMETEATRLWNEANEENDEDIIGDEPRPAGHSATCEQCETTETVYQVHLSVVVTLTGAPTCHTPAIIHENVLARLEAGDHHDTDKTEVIEVTVDGSPTCPRCYRISSNGEVCDRCREDEEVDGNT